MKDRENRESKEDREGQASTVRLGEAAGFREAERAESDAAVKKEVKNTVEFYSRRRYTEIRKGAECNAEYQTYF